MGSKFTKPSSKKADSNVVQGKNDNPSSKPDVVVNQSESENKSTSLKPLEGDVTSVTIVEGNENEDKEPSVKADTSVMQNENEGGDVTSEVVVIQNQSEDKDPSSKAEATIKQNESEGLSSKSVDSPCDVTSETLVKQSENKTEKLSSKPVYSRVPVIKIEETESDESGDEDDCSEDDPMTGDEETESMEDSSDEENEEYDEYDDETKHYGYGSDENGDGPDEDESEEETEEESEEDEGEEEMEEEKDEEKEKEEKVEKEKKEKEDVAGLSLFDFALKEFENKNNEDENKSPKSNVNSPSAQEDYAAFNLNLPAVPEPLMVDQKEGRPKACSGSQPNQGREFKEVEMNDDCRGAVALYAMQQKAKEDASALRKAREEKLHALAAKVRSQRAAAAATAAIAAGPAPPGRTAEEYNSDILQECERIRKRIEEECNKKRRFDDFSDYVEKRSKTPRTSWDRAPVMYNQRNNQWDKGMDSSFEIDADYNMGLYSALNSGECFGYEQPDEPLNDMSSTKSFVRSPERIAGSRDKPYEIDEPEAPATAPEDWTCPFEDKEDASPKFSLHRSRWMD